MKDEPLPITRGTSVALQLLLIESNGSVASECFRPGNVQNPSSDVYLNEVQLGVSFALKFENEVYFSSQNGNFIWRSRAVLWAGITTVHWLELLPAPTPAPTASVHGDLHVSTIPGR